MSRRIESLTARLERAPKLCSWQNLWMTDRAVVGVWPAGDSLKVVTESKHDRTESRRGLVLDYGFLPGAEDELEALLRAWCTRLTEEKIDTLSMFNPNLQRDASESAQLVGRLNSSTCGALASPNPGIRWNMGSIWTRFISESLNLLRAIFANQWSWPQSLLRRICSTGSLDTSVFIANASGVTFPLNGVHLPLNLLTKNTPGPCLGVV
jgi:hypothetical protein